MMLVAFLGMSAAIAWLVAVFAEPVGRFNEDLVYVLPHSVRRTYRKMSLGKPYDSPMWIRYNRIGGTCLGLLLLVAIVAIHA